MTLSSSEGLTLASSGPGSTATDGCYETDCAGDCYGDAEDLACGCNDADSCNDCAGVPNGDSTLDDCGVCDGGNADDLGCGCFEAAPSGCDNACGSTATLDNCGTCDDDSSNDCVQDLSLIHI